MLTASSSLCAACAPVGIHDLQKAAKLRSRSLTPPALPFPSPLTSFGGCWILAVLRMYCAAI